jgi:hypothetical protein
MRKFWINAIVVIIINENKNLKAKNRKSKQRQMIVSRAVTVRYANSQTIGQLSLARFLSAFLRSSARQSRAKRSFYFRIEFEISFFRLALDIFKTF